MLGAIAQFETEIRAEWQMDGIQAAKARVVPFGQQRKLTDSQIAEMQQHRKEGVLIKTLMTDYQLSKANIYRYPGESPSNKLS